MAEELLPSPGLGFCEAFEVYWTFSILYSQCTERNQTIPLDGICEGQVCWIINSQGPFCHLDGQAAAPTYAACPQCDLQPIDYFSRILSYSWELLSFPLCFGGRDWGCFSRAPALALFSIPSCKIPMLTCQDCETHFADKDTWVLRIHQSSVTLLWLSQSEGGLYLSVLILHCHKTKSISTDNQLWLFSVLWGLQHSSPWIRWYTGIL